MHEDIIEFALCKFALFFLVIYRERDIKGIHCAVKLHTLLLVPDPSQSK